MERSTIKAGEDDIRAAVAVSSDGRSIAPTMDPTALRGEFPVLRSVAYLNTGTNGPVPRRAAQAAALQVVAEAERGRTGAAHYAYVTELKTRVRERLAALFGCAAGELAITHSTTDGLNTVLGGFPLGPGDEVLTTDEEHPGLLAPLATARERRGFSVRVVPFHEIAGEVGASTRLVACSHVSWVTGQVVDLEALGATGVPVALDGAQGLGAVPTRALELGCDYYAASGQKWLCGPDASGCLYVRQGAEEHLGAPWPGYESLSDPGLALELELHDGARRFDVGPLPGPLAAWWLASLDVLAAAGWDAVSHRAVDLAGRLASMLQERGYEVAARGESTLVSWRMDDPEVVVNRLAEARVMVRHLPGRGLVRASVGAWNGEHDLERLLSAL